MREAGILVFAYLVGSIPIGLIVGKLAKGIDIRDFGSGNIGATNVYRALGPIAGAAVLIGDLLKGYAPVALAQALVSGPYKPLIVIAAGMLSILGHNASLFLGFKGGKGVATSLGVIVGINPLIAAIAFVFWAVLVAVTRYVSIASITATFSVPTMMYFSQPLFHTTIPRAYTIFALVAALLILLKHRSNIKRLLSHTEPKFGQKVKLDDTPDRSAGSDRSPVSPDRRIANDSEGE